jgi:regulator of replication initiation timing
MKAVLLAALLIISANAFAQSPEALKYAPRPILLMSGNATEEGVMPMLLTTDGVQHLEFVPISRIKEFAEHGGLPIRLGDVLSALGEATQNISKLQEDNARLQAENERLWKVAMKDAPRPQAPTVVVQQAPPAQPSPLEKYMLLRSLIPAAQPYQLPMPVNPNANRVKTTCTSNAIGNTTVTNCR